MSQPDKPLQNWLGPRSLTAGTQITLQVGGRRFVTTGETLSRESGFFSTLLSGHWDHIQADGSFLIDADPQLFEHILRYLRRGVLPVFYDNSKGHDHALYLALMEEAKYFQISRLVQWIESRRFLDAVKIVWSAKELDGAAGSVTETTRTDTEVEYHSAWRTQKTYTCPRGIPVHQGDPSACGRLCKNAQSSNGTESKVEEDGTVLKVLVTRKQTVFNYGMCVKGRISGLEGP